MAKTSKRAGENPAAQSEVDFSQYGLTQIDGQFLREIVSDRMTLLPVTEANAHLEQFGILVGDVIIVERHDGDFDDGQLTVWDVAADPKHYHTGIAYENFGEISIIRGEKTERHDKRRLKLVGTVRWSMRPIDLTKKDEIDARALEVSVVCADCGKKDKGTRHFLKADGWKLKSDKNLCVRCW